MKAGKKVRTSRTYGLILQQNVLPVEFKCLRGIQAKNFVEEYSSMYRTLYDLDSSDIRVTG
jgi:hypothetical protein